MPLIAQTHCFVLSIVVFNQTVIYVVSKSTNQDKNFCKEHIKKLSTPAENSNQHIFSKQDENSGNSQVWKS